MVFYTIDLVPLLNLSHMSSELALDIQEQKNLEAADQPTTAQLFQEISSAAEKDMTEALAGGKDTFMAYINGQAKEMGIDPNDYQEDDKVPADPQEKDGNDASNY